MSQNAQQELFSEDPHVTITVPLTEAQRRDMQAEADSRSIFVGNVSMDITPEMIEEHFGRYGPIERITVVNNTHKKGTAHAYVEFETEDSMLQAIEADLSVLDGNVISVAKKRTNIHAFRHQGGIVWKRGGATKTVP